MKCVEKIISKLILKKSTTNLKISIIILMVVLLASTSIFMFIISHNIQTNKDFYNNPKMRLIQVMSHKDAVTHENMVLDFKDIKYISDILKNKYRSKQYYIVTCYMFNFGITTNLNESFFITGLDSKVGEILFGQKLNDDVLYLHAEYKKSLGNVQLKVPIIKQEQGGFCSKETKNIDLKICNTIKTDPIDLFEHSNINDVGVVSLKTFKKIMETSYNMPWLNLTSNQEFFIPNFIDKLYVYSYDIKDVPLISKYLKQYNYDVYSPLLAFENSNLSLTKIKIFFYSIMIIVCILVFAQFILSFKFYLRIQKKDIGILKQIGYNNNQVFKFYKSNINKMFYLLSIIISTYTIILGFFILTYKQIYCILIILLIFNLFLWLSNLIVTRAMLKKIISLNILQLLKQNKEFE